MGFSRQEYWSGSPFPSAGEFSWPRDRTWVSCIADGFFTNWASREAVGYQNSELNFYWLVLKSDRPLAMRNEKQSSFIRVCVCVCAQPLSRVWLFCSPVDWSTPGPLPLEFSRQDYWSGVPLPTPTDLPNPKIELTSPGSPSLAAGVFTLMPHWKRCTHIRILNNSCQ